MNTFVQGIPESDIEPMIDSICEAIKLKQFADKLVMGYSGGNKRKLSVAVAMIGDPKILFLDEPTV